MKTTKLYVLYHKPTQTFYSRYSWTQGRVKVALSPDIDQAAAKKKWRQEYMLERIGKYDTSDKNGKKLYKDEFELKELYAEYKILP